MPLTFAARVFQIAGIWGLFSLTFVYASYLLGLPEAAVGATKPEYVHGFFLVTLSWQVAFLMISTDPVRYRPLMIAAMLEKFPFALTVIVLYARGQVPSVILILGLIDGGLGTLFAMAYQRTKPLTGTV